MPPTTPMEQHLQTLTTELGKVKAEVLAGGAKVHAAATDKLPALRARANTMRQQIGAATHAGLAKFEAELSDLEAKAKAALAKSRG
jgi:hypothetical protein